jgi:hypothetical protein
LPLRLKRAANAKAVSSAKACMWCRNSCRIIANSFSACT